MMAYYVSGMVYFYGISNYVIHMPISWKLVVINCFLITVVEDFSSLRYGGISGKKDPGAGRRYVPELELVSAQMLHYKCGGLNNLKEYKIIFRRY